MTNYGVDVDKFDKFGLTPKRATKVGEVTGYSGPRLAAPSLLKFCESGTPPVALTVSQTLDLVGRMRHC